MLRYELADGIGTLRLAEPPLNVLSLELLFELRAAIERAQQDTSVRAIVLAGDEDVFSAGADIELFRQSLSPAEAAALSETFQATFKQIEDSPKPVVAALAGRVIGGALELAMACHRRVATDTARFQMAEVNLGLVPGAGGTQRLPRLVGLELALPMLLTGAVLEAEEAFAAELVDEICPSSLLFQVASEAASTIDKPEPTSRRTGRIDDAEANAAALDEAERRIALMPPQVAAPRLMLQCVRTGIERSFADGIQAERAAFAESVGTAAARNKIHLFFATRQTAKLPELQCVEPLPVERAAVVGAGTMGTGIALALLQAGIPVVAVDERTEALSLARARVENSLHRRVSDGKLTEAKAQEILSTLQCSERWEDIAGADLVVESVFEDPGVKETVLARVEAVSGPRAIIATNTSTLSLTKISASMNRPERLVGMHFFNPAQRMPLLEVIRRPETPREILAGVLAVARRLRKTPVVAASREGFIVVRLFVPYVQEAFRLLEEGAGADQIDQIMVEFGFPMGPFELIDMTGLDILSGTHRVLQAAFPWHGPASPTAEALVDQGHLGQKTGSGVYRYSPGDRRPQPNPALNEVVESIRRDTGQPPRPIDSDEISKRLQMRMLAEAMCVLAEGVARSADDIDVATTLGIGFPDFRGGVMTYLEQLGRRQVVAQLEQLGRDHGERFTPESALQMNQGDNQ